MKSIKKTIASIISISLLLVNTGTGSANEKFYDKNIASFINDSSSKFVVAELNTGKIIAEQNPDTKVSYKNLINKIAVFSISEKLKDKSLTLEHRITLLEDEVLKDLKISKDISIKDTIFLLEQGDSPTLAISVLKALNIDITQAQAILDKLTLADTELNKLEISSDNKISARNLAYLNQETLRNFYEISQLTSQEKYTLENGNILDNDIPISVENSKILGLSHDNTHSEIVVNSTNTNFLITVLDSSTPKETTFENLKKLYPYLFANYSYQVVLKAGTHRINEQDIVINSEIFDLLYQKHDINNLSYRLMNDRIVLIQNYDLLSANNASVFSTYKPATEEKENIKKILINNFEKNTSIRGFSEKEKLNSIISNTSYIISLILIVYTILYSLVFIFKKVFRRQK